MSDTSQVIRLSTRAILEYCRGNTDLIMAELAEKLPALAAKLGQLANPAAVPWTPGTCPYHRQHILTYDRNLNAWVCPAEGCKTKVVYEDEFAALNTEIGKMLERDAAEKAKEARGHGHSGGRKRRKKPKPRKLLQWPDQK